VCLNVLLRFAEDTLSVVAKEYEDNIKLLSDMDGVLQPFVTNQQV
jgi:hypothetical protein